MSLITSQDIKEFIINYLNKKLEHSGKQIDMALPDGFDLLEGGLIDSMGMLNLTIQLEEHFRKDIDFEELDPEDMTIIGCLCQYVEERVN